VIVSLYLGASVDLTQRVERTWVLGLSTVTLVESLPRLTSMNPGLVGSIDSGLKLSDTVGQRCVALCKRTVLTTERIEVTIGQSRAFGGSDTFPCFQRSNKRSSNFDSVSTGRRHPRTVACSHSGSGSLVESR
jgi:hypothetical protein